MQTAEQMIELTMLPDIKELTENYWRAFLTAGTLNPPMAVEITRRFEAKVAEIAAGLGGEHGQAFQAITERERERLFEEYQADHAAFRRRLGVPPLEEALPAVGPPPAQHRPSVGETVVRTAVRATVWEAVRALFRL